MSILKIIPWILNLIISKNAVVSAIKPTGIKLLTNTNLFVNLFLACLANL